VADRAWWHEIADAERRQVSEVEGEAIMTAVAGLQRGDLRPLAVFLRAGFPLNYMIRRELVDAIGGTGGGGFYTLTLVKNRRGVGNAHTPWIKFARQMEIVEYFEKERAVARNRKTAMDATKDRFAVGKTTIEEAIAAIEKWRAAVEEQAQRHGAESGEKAK
jgi:hypothetical protein